MCGGSPPPEVPSSCPFGIRTGRGLCAVSAAIGDGAGSESRIGAGREPAHLRHPAALAGHGGSTGPVPDPAGAPRLHAYGGVADVVTAVSTGCVFKHRVFRR